jgi:hypothetical protein
MNLACDGGTGPVEVTTSVMACWTSGQRHFSSMMGAFNMEYDPWYVQCTACYLEEVFFGIVHWGCFEEGVLYSNWGFLLDRTESTNKEFSRDEISRLNPTKSTDNHVQGILLFTNDIV